MNTNSKKALVVIDMQNDYLWKDRKPMFSYNTDELVSSVNRAIADYQNRGYDILYVEQLFPNIVTNRWFIGFSIKGTPGAELFDGLDVVSDHIFEKNLPNSFTASSFRDHVKREGYSDLVLCGLDECGCVGATAKGALKAGLNVTLLESCIGCRFPDARLQKMRASLRAIGAVYVN